jgi:hypothetical protein
MRLAEETTEELSTDEMTIAFGFLRPVDIMPLRLVCTTWSGAAENTLVPLTDFVVYDVR